MARIASVFDTFVTSTIATMWYRTYRRETMETDRRIDRTRCDSIDSTNRSGDSTIVEHVVVVVNDRRDHDESTKSRLELRWTRREH